MGEVRAPELDQLVAAQSVTVEWLGNMGEGKRACALDEAIDGARQLLASVQKNVEAAWFQLAKPGGPNVAEAMVLLAGVIDRLDGDVA